MEKNQVTSGPLRSRYGIKKAEGINDLVDYFGVVLEPLETVIVTIQEHDFGDDEASKIKSLLEYVFECVEAKVYRTATLLEEKLDGVKVVELLRVDEFTGLPERSPVGIEIGTNREAKAKEEVSHGAE